MELRKDSSCELPNDASSNVVEHWHFDDIDELAIFLPEDVHLTLLENKPFHCRSSALNLDAIQFNFSRVNRNLYAVGHKQTEFLTFSMILRGKGRHGIESGRLVTEDYLFGFDSNREADLVFPGGSIYCAVYIRPGIFEFYTRAMDRLDLDARFFASNYVYIPESFTPLRNYLKQLYKLLIQHSPLLQEPNFQQIILQDFLPLLITALPAQRKCQTSTRFFRRAQLVKYADDYMRSHINQPLTLTDLCQALGTSSRALCYGFQEIFGMSPMSYLKILRLQGAYRVLKVAQSNTITVTEIATQFGFYHLGYFAQDYKQMFGELPSETIKRSRLAD